MEEVEVGAAAVALSLSLMLEAPWFVQLSPAAEIWQLEHHRPSWPLQLVSPRAWRCLARLVQCVRATSQMHRRPP